MKKRFNLIYITVGLLILLISIFIKFQEYHYGYFKSIANLGFNHPDADAFLLNNKRILILGDSFNNIPSEIYDINSKSVNIYKIQQNIYYAPEGILLDNNKLFLLRTCIDKNCGYSINYDLNNNKVEYIYNSTFNIGNVNLNNILQNYILLNNNIIFYISYKSNTNQSEIGIFETKQKQKHCFITNENLSNARSVQIDDNNIFIITINNAYIYNIKNSKLNKLDFPYSKLFNSVNNNQRITHLVGLKDKILIFVYLTNDKYKDYNLTLSFDLNTHQFNKLSSSPILRDYNIMDLNYISNIIQLNDKQILINGGVANIGKIGALFGGHYKFINSNEIYDIRKNEFYKIINMPYAKFGHRAIWMNNKEVLLIGGITKRVIGSIYNDETNKIIKFKIF